MTLATRCPNCHTTFRVVKDQLRLAEGWVRCGRCDDIFRATDHLVDLNKPLPAPAVTSEVAADSAPDMAPPQDRATPDPSIAPSTFSATALMDMVEPGWKPEPSPDPSSVMVSTSFAGTSQQELRHFAWEQATAVKPLARSLRVLIWALTLALTLTLLAQGAWTFREPLARQGIPLLPSLYQLCVPWGCEAKPLADLDGLVIESSELTRLAGGVHLLSLNLRNRRSVELRMPALELSLSDATGSVLLRRVVEPRDWGYLGQVLDAHTEIPIRLGLDAGSRAVAGYSVEVFYP